MFLLCLPFLLMAFVARRVYLIDTLITCVIISYCCSDKLPQTWQLRAYKCIIIQFQSLGAKIGFSRLRWRCRKSRVSSWRPTEPVSFLAVSSLYRLLAFFGSYRICPLSKPATAGPVLPTFLIPLPPWSSTLLLSTTWRVLDNLPILTAADSNPTSSYNLNSPLLDNITYSLVLGIGTWASLREPLFCSSQGIFDL